MRRRGVPAALMTGLVLLLGLLVPPAQADAPREHARTASPRAGSPLPPPTDLAARPGPKRAKLTWTAPSDPRVNGFEVTRHPGGEVIPLPNGTEALVDFGLDNGTTYHYTIVSVSDGYGRSEVVDFPSVTPADQPARPRVLRATCVQHRLSVTWRAPDDRGSAVTAYRVRAAGTVQTLGPRARSATVRQVPRDQGVRVRVKAKNALGWGRWAEARCR